MGDIVGKSGITASQLEAGGSKLYAQLPLAAQSWAQRQATALVSKGQFGPAQQRDLENQAGVQFPAADTARIIATVRYLALKASTGNSFGQLFSKTGPTLFQQQLMAGLSLRR
jgi:hypothetical protein